MSKKCEICEKESGLQCSACKSVWYCCKDHQKQDWKNHKLKCTYQQKNVVVTMSISFNSLTFPDALDGWESYFHSRKIFKDTPPDKYLHSSLYYNVNDCLSFPLTIAFAIKALNITLSKGLERPNFIYIIGADVVEEGAIGDDKNDIGANCWAELGKCFPDSMIGLVLIGPNISKGNDGRAVMISTEVFATFCKSTFHEWCDRERAMKNLQAPTLICLFNPGLGYSSSSSSSSSSVSSANKSWDQTFEEIRKMHVPVLVTMCNDGDDRESNMKYLNELKPSFLINPIVKPNPFGSQKVLRLVRPRTSPPSPSSSSSSDSLGPPAQRNKNFTLFKL